MIEQHVKNTYIGTNLSPKKIQLIRKNSKIKIVNQNLDQAIKQMRQTIKQKPKISNNPQKNSNSEIKNQHSDQIDHMFFTQTYKRKMEMRLSQIEQRQKQLNAKSLQKQMRARLLRKIQQNLHLKGKMQLLNDIKQRREMLINDKQNRDKRRKQQLNLLHQSNLVNAEMLRRSKIKIMKKQLNQSRFKEQQSLKNLKYKNYLEQKQKQSRIMLLTSRHQFMAKSQSQKTIHRDFLSSQNQSRRPRNFSRSIRTSHFNNRNGTNNHQETEYQQLIINQYSDAGKQGKNDDITTASGRAQKKYNQNVRKTQSGLNDNASNKQQQFKIQIKLVNNEKSENQQNEVE